MSEKIKEDPVSERNKNSCFIITPIGNNNTEIRRHIDGLIDECIIPVLQSKYVVEVAHRITTPGSINNQVIEKIYNADLVVANLTDLNANVMYELAFRHAIRKSVILIMENGEKKLPFDVTTERTIFYDNDFQGAIELKKNLKNMVDSIEGIHSDIIDNPIYSALEKMDIKERVIKNLPDNENSEIKAFEYILNRLDNIENKFTLLERNRYFNNKNNIVYDNVYNELFSNAILRNKIVLRLNKNIKNKENAKAKLENVIDNKQVFQELDELEYLDDNTVVFSTKAYGNKLKNIVSEFDRLKEWQVIDVHRNE